MRFRTLSLSLLMLAAAATAQAHTHLERSIPADKSRVQAPAAIEMHFSEVAKLTALTLQKGKEAAQPIKPLPAKATAEVSVPVPTLAPGDYVVSWRVVGDDGHVMSGNFGFTVDPAAPAASAKPSIHEGMKMDDHGHMDHMKSTEEKKSVGTEDQHKH